MRYSKVMNKLFSTIIIFFGLTISGCGTSEYKPLTEPPMFCRGDRVKLKTSTSIGIVVNVEQQRIDPSRSGSPVNWAYKVMYEQTDFYFFEDKLELAERYNWHPVTAVTAEVTAKEFEKK